jgi:hypothetical protein
LSDGAIDLGSDANEIGKYFRIIRARVVVRPDDDQRSRKEGANNDSNAYDPAKAPALRICFVFGHRISSGSTKEHKPKAEGEKRSQAGIHQDQWGQQLILKLDAHKEQANDNGEQDADYAA